MNSDEQSFRVMLNAYIETIGSENEATWFEFDSFKVYIRPNGIYMVEGVTTRCMAVGSIEVSSAMQRQGIFKRVLGIIEQCCKKTQRPCVYIQNIMEDWLKEKVIEYGYKSVDGDSFYKRNDNILL
jgi:N-acetylglutamate synthase-like GNAT family acetyltransferase